MKGLNGLSGSSAATGGGVVRTIAMGSSEGLRRGLEVDKLQVTNLLFR